MNRYTDRQKAGRVLAKKLEGYKNRADTLVLALPRGGVPVAFEIAKTLHLPLDVFVVRKLGLPNHIELAMGAIAMGEITVINKDIIDESNTSIEVLKRVMQIEKKELNRRIHAYRGDQPFPLIEGQTILLVDDGIATGATMRAAITALRQLKPDRIIVAVPVAEKSISARISALADQLICPLRPEHFYAVGAWYGSFEQTTDEEVHFLLQQARNLISK